MDQPGMRWKAGDLDRSEDLIRFFERPRQGGPSECERPSKRQAWRAERTERAKCKSLLREPSGRTGSPIGAESVKVPAIFYGLLGGLVGEKETGRIGELGNRPRVPSGNLFTTHDADAHRNTGILGHEESTFSASQI